MPSLPSTTDAVIERTFEVGAGGRCRLRVPRARVTLESGPAGTAEATLAAADGTAPEAARAFAETLRVRYDDGLVRIEPEHSLPLDAPDWRTLRAGAPVLHLHVRVPSDFGADVHASGGHIDARGLGGAVTLEATGGTVRAGDLSGRLNVQVRHCETIVENFSGKKGSALVYGGAFTLRGAEAETLDVQSSGANLTFEDLSAALHLEARQGRVSINTLRGALDAEVYGGTCTFAPEAASEARARLHAPGSDVRLRLPADFAADLRLAAHRLRFEPPGRFEGEHLPREVDGTLGGGGVRVDVSAPGGSIRCA